LYWQVTSIQHWEGDLPGNPVQKAIETIAENVTGTVVPLSGHWIPEDRPEFVIEQLTAFFNKE
jgi:pimeloyl-ACP methyl ester carboxylesterase